MKKLLGILVLGLLLGGYANASIECTQERKEWSYKWLDDYRNDDDISPYYPKLRLNS
jgi:hypothetical protein